MCTAAGSMGGLCSKYGAAGLIDTCCVECRVGQCQAHTEATALLRVPLILTVLPSAKEPETTGSCCHLQYLSFNLLKAKLNR